MDVDSKEKGDRRGGERQRKIDNRHADGDRETERERREERERRGPEKARDM